MKNRCKIKPYLFILRVNLDFRVQNSSKPLGPGSAPLLLPAKH